MQIARVVVSADKSLVRLICGRNRIIQEGSVEKGADVAFESIAYGINEALKPYLDAADKMAEAIRGAARFAHDRGLDCLENCVGLEDHFSDKDREAISAWQAMDIKGREGDR